jgi:4-hydroxy-tetrahydrodipicolinate synthase
MFFGKKPLLFSPNKLSGLIVPMVTPLNEDKTVDVFALKVLSAHLLNKGIANLFVFGPYSEHEFVSLGERKKFLEVMHAELEGKGVLLAGCFGKTTDETIQLVQLSEKYTNLCVVSVPDEAKTNEVEFIDFFDSLFRHTNASFLLYNDSVFSSPINPAWLDNIVNWERFFGLIDYSKNVDYIMSLAKYKQVTKLFEESKDLAFFVLRHGFAGLSCVSSIMFPSFYLTLANSMEGFELRNLLHQEARVDEVKNSFPKGKRVSGLKYVLSLQGLIKPFCFDDSKELLEEEKQLIKKALLPEREALLR